MKISSSMRQSRHLLVTNLPDCITEDRISDHFKRYGKVQSVKCLQPGCATVAFIDIRSAAKAFTSLDNLIDERILKTEYYEPPVSSTASSAIFIHETRDDVLPRPANSHTSSSSSSIGSVGVSASASTPSAFCANNRSRHSSLNPASRSSSVDRLYNEREQRPGACNNYDRSRRLPHHEQQDLRERIPRDRPAYRSSDSGSGDRKRRHLEVIKPVNAKDRTGPDLRLGDKAPGKLADAPDEEVVRKTTTFITHIIRSFSENEPHAVVDAHVVLHEPSPASDHSGRRSSGCKPTTPRVSSTPGKDCVRTVDAALAVNISLTDPRRSLSSSSVFPSSVNSSRPVDSADSADAESGIVTSTDSLPHDVYASSHKNEDHGCEVSSSSDKPLVKTLTVTKIRKESCWSLPLPEFAAEKFFSELTTSSKSQHQPVVVAPFTSITTHAAIPSPKSNAITSPINIFSPCPLPPKRLRECSTDSKGSEVTTSDRDSTDNVCVSKHVADLSSEPPKKSPRSPKSFTDRIKALDERIHLWSNSNTTAMPAATVAAVPAKCDLPPTPTIDYSKYNIKKKSHVNQTASGDSQRSEPSDIVKNLLSKSSIFDQDTKRLEHINEKYEPSKDPTEPLSSASRPTFRTKAAAKEFAPSEADARRSSMSSSSSSTAVPVTGLASLSRKMSEPSKLPSVKKDAPTTPLSAPARSFSNAFTPFSCDKKKDKCPAADQRREGDACRNDPRTQKPEDSAKMMSEKKPLIQKSHSMPSGSKNPSTQQIKSSDSRAFGAISEAKRWSSSDFMDTDSEPVKGDSKQISKQISNKSKIASSSSTRESHSKSETGVCVKKEKTDLQKAPAVRDQLKPTDKSARKSDAVRSDRSLLKCKGDADRSQSKSEKSLKDRLLKKEQDRKSGKNRSAPDGSKKKEKLSAKCKELRKLGITEEPVYLSMYDKVKARSSANQSLPKAPESVSSKSKSESKQSRRREEDSSTGSDSDSSSASGSEVERKRKRKRVIQSSSSSSSDEDSGPHKACSVKSSPRPSGLANKSKSKSSVRAVVDSDSDSDERSSARKTKVKRKGVGSKKQAGSSAVFSSSSSSSSSSDEDADEEDEKDEDDERVPPSCRKKQQRKGLHKGSHRASVSSDDQSSHEKRSADHVLHKKTKKAERKTEKEMMVKKSKTQDRTSEKQAAASAEKQRESDSTTSKIKATAEVRDKSHAAQQPSASKAAFCESSNKVARKKNKSFLKEKERLKDSSSLLHKKHSLHKSQHDKYLHNSDSSGSPKKKKFKKEDSCSRDRPSVSNQHKTSSKTGRDPDHRMTSDSSDQEMHLGHSLLRSDLSDSDSMPPKAKAVISHTEWERSERGHVSKPVSGLSKMAKKSSGSMERTVSNDRSERTSFEKIISINDAALFEKKKLPDSMSEARRARMSSGSSDQDSKQKQKQAKKQHRECDFDRSHQKDILSFANIMSSAPERKPSPPVVSSTSDNIVSAILKSPVSSDSPLTRDNLSESSEDMKLDRDLTEAAQRTAEKAEHLESDASSDDLMLAGGSDDVHCLPKNKEDKERPQRSFDQEAAIETKRLEVELNQSWKSESSHHFDGLICSTTAEPIPQTVDEEPVSVSVPELVSFVAPEVEVELRHPSPLVIESSQEKDGKEDHRRMEDDLAVSALLQEMDDGPVEQETGIESEIPYLGILTDEEPTPLHISEDLQSEQLKQAISSVLPQDTKECSAAHAPAVEAVADPISKPGDEKEERNSALEESKATAEPSVDILSAFNRSPVKRLSTESEAVAQTTVAPTAVAADEPRSPTLLIHDTDSMHSDAFPSTVTVGTSENSAADGNVISKLNLSKDDAACDLDERKGRTRKMKGRKAAAESVACGRQEKADVVSENEKAARRRPGTEKIRRSPRVASLEPDPSAMPTDAHDELSGDELHTKWNLCEVSDHADESDAGDQKKRRGRRKKASGDSHSKPVLIEPIAPLPEPKLSVKERLHVSLPAVDRPAADTRKSLSPYDVFDFRDDDDESLPLSMPPLKAVETKQVVAPVAPPVVEEKKIAVPVPAAIIATVAMTPSPPLLPVPSVPSSSATTTIAAISCDEIPLKASATANTAVPEVQDKREADKEKDAKYIAELSGHGKLSMTIRLKEGQADGGTAEIVKTSVKVPEEQPKPVKPIEETDVVKATRKSARLMSQNKSTVDEVIDDVVKGKSTAESEVRLRRIQRRSRKSEDSTLAPDVSEDGDMSEDQELWDRNQRSYRQTRSSTRGSTGGEEADTADEGSNPAVAPKSVRAAGEVTDKVADQELLDDSSETSPVIEPLLTAPHPPPPPPPPPPQTSDVPAVTRKDADPASQPTAEVKRLQEEDAAPMEQAATPSDKLTKGEPLAPVPPPTTNIASSANATPFVIQEPHRTPLIPSVSERIHNSTTAQKLKTGKGLEYLIEEPPVAAPEGRVEEEKNHVAVVQPPPAHTKITIEAKQPAIQTSIVQSSLPLEKKSPVGRATRTPDIMSHHMPHFGREVDQNLQQQHLVPQQQKEYLAAVQQQEMALRLQQEQRLAPPVVNPPHQPASPHMRPMPPLHAEHLPPYNMPQIMFPYGMHPELRPPHLPPRMPTAYPVPMSDQKDAVRTTIEKEEQKIRSRAKAADEARERMEQQQYAADEEAFKRLQMASNQMRGIAYHPQRVPHHLLSPLERVSDSPGHTFHSRQHVPGSGDHKIDFQHSPIVKADMERKPVVSYPPSVVSSADMSRSFGIASPAPTYIDGRSVHPAAHSPGPHAFRPKVPSPMPSHMSQREEELRKLHHLSYGKEMNSPVGLNMSHTGGYHLPLHLSVEHNEGLLSRSHSQLMPEGPPHLLLPAVRPHSPQPAPQVPASGDSILLQRYPVVWQGLLALKNDQAAVQMHFISGSTKIAHSALTPVGADGHGPQPIRICQRMRLEQTQLDGVVRKMQMPDEHCILLALPCGRDHADVLQQSNNLKSGFISYLQSKHAAGIVNSSGPGPQATSFVIHIFPSSDFSTHSMSRIAPDLLQGIADIAHLMIIIATV